MKVSIRIRLFVIALLLVLVTDGVGGGNNPQEDAVKKLAAERLMNNFEPSLEMKESTDFLLTPAILVQEAISSNVVLTYPAE